MEQAQKDPLPGAGPTERLAHWAQHTPDAPAWVDATQRISYEGLAGRVRCAQHWLVAQGVQAGDTVAFGLKHDPAADLALLALFYGCAGLGAIILPFYPDSPRAVHGHLTKRLGAKWFVFFDDEKVTAALGLSLHDYLQFSAHWTEQPEPSKPSADSHLPFDRPFLYEFTSGTTGDAKTILFTGPQYVGKMIPVAAHYGLGTHDVWLPALPWPSKVGIRSVVRAHSLGAAHGQFDFPLVASQFVQLVAQHGVSWMVSVPWQLRRLLADAVDTATPAHNPPGLRFMVTSGAFFAPHEVEAVRQTLCTRFYLNYGTSELGSMAFLGVDDPPDRGLQLVAGMAAQAVDGVGLPLGPNQSGRLRFCSSWMPDRYVINNTPRSSTNDKPYKEQAEFFFNGWYVSSDMGFLDAQGRLHLVGRDDEVVNAGGNKLHPNAIETALLAHPDIADAALVGIPDPVAGEIAAAFVVIRKPIAAGALQIFLNACLDTSQIPTLIVAAPAIPRNTDGKILREPLRRAYLDSLNALNAGTVQR